MLITSINTVMSLLISSFLSGIICGTFLTLLVFKRKSHRGIMFLIEAIIVLAIIILIPLLYQTITNLEHFFHSTAFQFGVSFAMGSITIAFYYLGYKRLMRLLDDKQIKHSFSFPVYMMKGHENMVEIVRKLIEKKSPKPLRSEATKMDVSIKALPFSVQEIRSINDSLYSLGELAKDSDMEPEPFAFFTSYSFLHKFLGRGNFSIRLLKKETMCMENEYTSRIGKKPGPIPVGKMSCIQRSLDLGHEVIIYSKNKDYHYETVSSINIKKAYDEYISCCLVGKNCIPLLSICIEVSGEIAAERLRQLVEMGYIRQLCLHVVRKYRSIVSDLLNDPELGNDESVSFIN